MTRADWVLRHSPLQPASRAITRDELAVLAFHGVDDPDRFTQLMDIVRQRWFPVSIEEADRAINGQAPLPRRAVLVTFDDGHRSVLEYGLPILAERGIPAVAFVIPGVLSTSEDFWWSAVADLAGARSDELVREMKRMPNDDRIAALIELERTAGRRPTPRPQLRFEELARLRSGGVEIGNHTWSHPCLNRCDPETIETEITNAHRALAASGLESRWFAYPNGDWAQHAETVLAGLEYRLAFLFDHRKAGVPADPLRVSRLRVNSDTNPDRFQIILSGLHPALHHARGRR